MTAHHFFLDDVSGDVLALSGEEAHHAARALRVRVGEEVTVGDGRGRVARGVVGSVTPTRVEVRVAGRTEFPRPSPSIRVFPAVPVAGKLDLVVQKLTELGVDRVSPWFAARSEVRWSPAKRASQAERWRSIARAAAKQSRRAWLPEIDAAGAIEDLPPLTLVFDEAAAERLSVFEPALGAAAEVVGVVVGPEGGLDDAERERFARTGSHAVSLGPAILRAETAAIVASALVLKATHLLG